MDNGKSNRARRAPHGVCLVLNMPHRKSNSDKNFLGGVIQVGYILLAACMSRSVALHRTPAGQAPPFDAPPDKHVFPSCPALFAYICIRENCHNLANCGSFCSVHRKKKPGRRRASDWDLGCYLCAEQGELLCCEAPPCTRTAQANPRPTANQTAKKQIILSNISNID